MYFTGMACAKSGGRGHVNTAMMRVRWLCAQLGWVAIAAQMDVHCSTHMCQRSCPSAHISYRCRQSTPGSVSIHYLQMSRVKNVVHVIGTYYRRRKCSVSAHYYDVGFVCTQGACSKAECPYLHVNLDPAAPVCDAFLDGYCAAGVSCRAKHLTQRMMRDSGAKPTLTIVGREASSKRPRVELNTPPPTLFPCLQSLDIISHA